jgi:hypothetical protein
LANPITIGAPSFLDYMRSTPRECINIIKGHRRMYLDPHSQGPRFYAPFRAALRRAASSVEPGQVIANAVASAWPTQRAHYVELENGFRRWWPAAKATGIPVQDSIWTSGELAVKVARPVGLRLRDDSTQVVFPYLKEPELTAEVANLILRILEVEMERLLPDAVPVALDVRRGRPFRLRRNANRSDLDAILAAEAAKYVTHWRAAA